MAKPSASATSNGIAQSGSRTAQEALPVEVMHNLQYQHHWTDLGLHAVHLSAKTSPGKIFDIVNTSIPRSEPDERTVEQEGRVFLISGLPPQHAYVHPDLLNHLAAHDVDEKTLPVQREWVLPLSTSDQQWTLRKFCGVFDALPARKVVEVAQTKYRHQDVKRVMCGMKARDGGGGDGTIVYYVMQDGDVKPRQN